VDHPTGAHDDHANALALAAALAIGGGRLPELYTFTIQPSRSPAAFDRSRPEHREVVAQVQTLYRQRSEEA
jgi:hypothetical protein